MPDLDLDGRPDIVYVTGSVYPEVEPRMPQYPHRGPRVTFRTVSGDGAGRFENVTTHSGPGTIAPHSSRGAAFGDFDNDGDVDVLVMNMNEAPSLLRNDYRGTNHWIELQLEGTTSNRSAIGALVTISANGHPSTRAVLSQSSYYSHDDLRLHFGLGGSRVASSIMIRWPSGLVESLHDIAGDRLVKIRERFGPQLDR
jgi:hypothetical protein